MLISIFSFFFTFFMGIGISYSTFHPLFIGIFIYFSTLPFFDGGDEGEGRGGERGAFRGCSADS